MPRRNRQPSYRYHKARDCAVTTFRGKNYYLGAWKSLESYEKYALLLAEFQASGGKHVPSLSQKSNEILRIKDLILRFFHFAQIEYVDENGEPTDEVTSIRIALRRLRKLFSNTVVVDFGPKSLKLVQQSMTTEGLSRKYINDSINRIRRMFRWAVSEEILVPSVFEALQSVAGLNKRRSKARQSKRVKPVTDEVVIETIKHLPPVIADMVRIQRLTSARPAEICGIQPGFIDRSSDVWEYEPAKHKTEHFDKERIIFIGPRAQQILRPYLLRAADAFCFNPVESELARNKVRRSNRKSPRTPSQRARKPKKDRKSAPRNCYATDSFRRAIHRACDQAFPPSEELDEKAKQAWKKLHRWSPNRLRHTGGTEIGDKYGLEAASTVMGNNLDVAKLYVERNLQKAREIIKEVG